VDVFLVVFMEKNSLASQAQADKKVWDNTSLTHSLCLSVSVSVSLCLSVRWFFGFSSSSSVYGLGGFYLFLFCLNPLALRTWHLASEGFCGRVFFFFGW
jgi:hypothetical protein